MRRLLLDTNVVLYAHGCPHPAREACIALLSAGLRGQAELHASTEMLQELLFHRIRRGTRSEAAQETRAVAMTFRLHPFDEAVWWRALALVEISPIRGRDAVHAATALEHDFTEIVTIDAGFAAVSGLTPIHPADVAL